MRRYNSRYTQENPETAIKSRRNRVAQIAAIKLASGCVDCGYNKHHAALQFDHVNGDKLFDIAKTPHRAWSKTLEEIEKCEVVCANCHAIRTYARRQEGRAQDSA